MAKNRKQQKKQRRQRTPEATATAPHNNPTQAAASSRHAFGLSSATLLPALALLLMVLVSFWPAFSAGFVWDDNVFIVKEPRVSTLTGLADIWLRPLGNAEFHYWPILYTSFWLDYQLWGFNPAGFHATNLLLHGANTVLLWRLLLRMNIPGAWLIAAVFALHPLRAEAVVWVIARKDLLATLFYLLAAGCWLRYRERPETATYLALLAWYVAGMLSKSVAITLPVVLLVWVWWQRGRIVGRDLAQITPLLLLGLAVGIYDMNLFNAQAVHDFNYSVAERLIIAGKAVWFYVGKLLWPHPLMFHYPHWDVSPANPLNWLGLLAALTLVAGLWLARHRIGRGPLAGILFFTITILPVLGLVSFGYMKFSFVADRYLYLPGIGLMSVLIAAAVTAWQRLSKHHSPLEGASKQAKPSLVGGQALVIILLTTYGTLTFQRAYVYENDIVLFRHIIATNPDAPEAWFNLGTVMMAQKQEQEAAIEAFREAIKQDPTIAKVYINLGSVLMKLERNEEAETAFRRAIELEPKDFTQESMPLRARHEATMAHLNLSNVLLDLKRPQDAETSLRNALALEPDDAIAQQSLASLLHQQGRNQEAMTLLRKLTQTTEPTITIYLLMGEVATALGRTELAARYFQQATTLKPEGASALAQQAAVHFKAGYYEKALEYYRRSIAIQPNNAEVHSNMGSALGQLGRMQEAIASFERALQINPQLESARANLALAKQRLNQPE
ncbi:MAG: tetratricopeptide repeat protein [Gammaproteobacteria bacterium]